MKKLVVTLAIVLVAAAAQADYEEARERPEQPMATEFFGAPGWVTGNCEAYWEESPGSRICGVGVVAEGSNPAMARSLAIARARAEIVETLKIRLDGMLTDYQSQSTQEAVARYVDRFESQMKTSTAGTLLGSKFQASWVSPNGSYYAMVSLDLGPIARAIKPDLSPAAAATKKKRFSAAWPDIAKAVSRGGSGRGDAALIIAIDDYAVAQDIPGAWSNALAWKEWLKRAHGVENVRVLRNQQATRESVLPAARGMAGLVKPGGRMWLVYIGHGAPAAEHGDGLLVLWDAQQTAASIAANSVSRQEVLEALSGAQADTVAVIDACFSGKTSGGDLAPGLAPLKVVGPRLVPGVTALTAAATNEYAGPLSDGSRPAFSYLVLGALRGWGDANSDGRVSSTEAVAYANEALTMTVTGNRSQTPSHEGDEVVLGRSGGERGPDLTELGMIHRPSAKGPSPRDAKPSATPLDRLVPGDVAPRRVAVLYFDNSGGQRELEAFSKGLAAILISDFEKLDFLEVLSRADLEKVLAELELQSGSAFDPATSVGVGKLLGAEFIITGGFFEAFGRLRMDARVIDVETGEIRSAEGVAGKPEDWGKLEKQLFGLLASSFGEQVVLDTQASAASSFDAVKRYSMALEKSDAGDAPAARSILDPLLREYPDFTEARQLLARLQPRAGASQ